VIITAGAPGGQLSWSEPRTGFSARTGLHPGADGRVASVVDVEFADELVGRAKDRDINLAGDVNRSTRQGRMSFKAKAGAAGAH
jgi:hypothetical protein